MADVDGWVAMAYLNSGDLDRDIVLQVGTPSQSKSGESTLVWTNVTEDTLDGNGTIAAQWLPAGSLEAWKAQSRLEGIIDGVFRIQFREDITPSYTRILWAGKTFDVRPPVEIGRQEGLDIPVTAIVS